MTIHQLLYFQTVAREGHMGRSAEKLLIAQPSLSVSMMKLEEELGLTLFDRRGHSLVLTGDGRTFLRHVNRILEDYENALAHASRLAAEHENRIAVGCVAPVFYQYLPEKTALFLKEEKNKDVKLSFDSGLTSELIEDLKKEKYDFILCSEAADPEIQQIPVILEPLVLIFPGGEEERIFSEKCREAGKGAETNVWDRISGLSLIGYDETSAMNETLKELAREERTAFQFIYRLPDEQSIAAFVERGLGCAIVPDTSILKKYAVRKMPLPGPGYCRKICITTRKGHKSTGAAKRFAELLERSEGEE